MDHIAASTLRPLLFISLQQLLAIAPASFHSKDSNWFGNILTGRLATHRTLHDTWIACKFPAMWVLPRGEDKTVKRLNLLLEKFKWNLLLLLLRKAVHITASSSMAPISASTHTHHASAHILARDYQPIVSCWFHPLCPVWLLHLNSCHCNKIVDATVKQWP